MCDSGVPMLLLSKILGGGFCGGNIYGNVEIKYILYYRIALEAHQVIDHILFKGKH